MLATLDILQNEKVKLIPFQYEGDFDYLIGIAMKYKYNITPKNMFLSLLKQYGVAFWNGYMENGVKGGVAYVCYYPEIGRYTFDAYRDNDLCKQHNPKGDYSYEAGKLLVPYILRNIANILYTTHSIENRVATIMCKRLGFKIVEITDTILGRFIVLKTGG